ncbi:SRPBCC domain-containing protein [Conexibacter sp. JD483]|uniref:SRPBCC family protein n=1 Tax=unclassified Conexibacter TaxID=2627773 RepID=UPI002725E79C|nr:MULTISPECIES: SRPBCC domain-containing protein [unclassified Conexibacter]MDO8189094.1 SRPBCC domain-containing protein [Conexibacter sp. CPCC 205706]MDO8201859.1 SRPBCC domain-containing protein [Conexibacter sp. CPCC 205762]MDR9372786.1 SRPBCC domain-containing protein [Conexibacter sp. JD483]
MSEEPLEVSAEIAGPPEQIWELIASGPGISAWFMPATVEPRVGGAIEQRHAPGEEGVARGEITAFEPPRRFVYEESWDDQTIATEYLVEARAGGSCVVRIVTHGLGCGDDAFADGLVSGWTQALATLAARVEAFDGLPVGFERLWAPAAGTLEEAWPAFLAALGLAGARAGDTVALAADGLPPLRGTVAVVVDHGLVLRTDAPAAGVLRVAGTGFGGRTSVVVDRYRYGGEDPQAAAAAERAAWERFLGA